MTAAPPPARLTLFLDFDGTISAGETFVKVLKTFTPDLAAELIPRIHAFDVTLREGVTRMLESIPSSQWEAAYTCADDVPLREGIAELVAWAKRNDIPLIVVSGGLEAMVRRKLGPLVHDITAVYAIQIDATGPFLKVVSPFADEQEMVAKVDVMAEHPADVRVAVGDSTTDVRMAQVAELVFARDRLCQQLDERGVAWLPWDDFNDIRVALAARWGLDA